MSNQFLSATEYANSMLFAAKNELILGKLVDGRYNSQVNDENGLTINVKRPPRFARNDASAMSAALDAQDIVTGSIPVTVNQYAKCHLSVGDIEWVTSYNQLMRNAAFKAAASTLAHQIDSIIHTQALKFHNWIAGTAPGTRSGNASDPTKMLASPAQAQAAYTRLKALGLPDTDLSGLMNFDDSQAISGSITSQFLPPDSNLTALQRSRVPVIGNINWHATQQIPVLTTGTRTQGDGSSTGAQVDGASQNVNYRDVKTTNQQTILLKGAGNAKTIKKGEVFTIQNCYAWDWRNQQASPDLQQFTVLADATTSSGGAVTLTISPPIIVQGTSDGTDTKVNTVFGTVDSAPADSAYIKFVGGTSVTFPVRYAFYKQAIALVSTPLTMPFTGTAAQVHDPETGISIRYWRASDVNTGAHYHRWDCMFGVAMTDPFLGTRVCGT